MEKNQVILIGDTIFDFKSNINKSNKKLQQISDEFQPSQLIIKYTGVAVTENEEHK